jgi:hypothetical protein
MTVCSLLAPFSARPTSGGFARMCCLSVLNEAVVVETTGIGPVQQQPAPEAPVATSGFR